MGFALLELSSETQYYTHQTKIRGLMIKTFEIDSNGTLKKSQRVKPDDVHSSQEDSLIYVIKEAIQDDMRTLASNQATKASCQVPDEREGSEFSMGAFFLMA